MSDVQSSTDTAGSPRDPGPRAFGLVLVGMSAVVWWPAFTLGAWGELFFDQLLTVWAVATAALVVMIARPRGTRRRWFHVAVLLVPSLWLLLAIIDDTDTADLFTLVVTIVGGLVGIVGLPFTLWTLVSVLWPELLTDLRVRARVGVATTVLVIAVASFVLGVFQDRFLTCQDFDISGNSEPPGCVKTPSAAPTNP